MEFQDSDIVISDENIEWQLGGLNGMVNCKMNCPR